MGAAKDTKESVTFRIDHELRELIEIVAKEERRSFSNQLNVALEEWARMKEELHPQFIKDIKEALKSGKPQSIWKG